MRVCTANQATKLNQIEKIANLKVLMLTFLTSSSCQNSNSFYEDLVDFMILKWLAVSDLALKKVKHACIWNSSF